MSDNTFPDMLGTIRGGAYVSVPTLRNCASMVIIAHGCPSDRQDGILTSWTDEMACHTDELSYRWSGVLNWQALYRRKLTHICMSSSGATISCLWLGIHQTSPDYEVWNCLGESASDIPTILILQFRHTYSCWIQWLAFFSPVGAELWRTGTNITSWQMSRIWVSKKPFDDCASHSMPGPCNYTRLYLTLPVTAPSSALAFYAWQIESDSLCVWDVETIILHHEWCWVEPSRWQSQPCSSLRVTIRTTTVPSTTYLVSLMPCKDSNRWRGMYPTTAWNQSATSRNVEKSCTTSRPMGIHDLPCTNIHHP